MSELALIVVVLSIVISNILCFFVGFKLALKTSNTAVTNEPLKVPKIKNPMEIFKEKEAQKELEKEMNDISKSLENIDNYGSDKPQQEI
jgi:uncharacterized protein YneF (UPF0154 family)